MSIVETFYVFFSSALCKMRDCKKKRERKRESVLVFTSADTRLFLTKDFNET